MLTSLKTHDGDARVDAAAHHVAASNISHLSTHAEQLHCVHIVFSSSTTSS